MRNWWKASRTSHIPKAKTWALTLHEHRKRCPTVRNFKPCTGPLQQVTQMSGSGGARRWWFWTVFPRFLDDPHKAEIKNFRRLQETWIRIWANPSEGFILFIDDPPRAPLPVWLDGWLMEWLPFGRRSMSHAARAQLVISEDTYKMRWNCDWQFDMSKSMVRAKETLNDNLKDRCRDKQLRSKRGKKTNTCCRNPCCCVCVLLYSWRCMMVCWFCFVFLVFLVFFSLILMCFCCFFVPVLRSWSRSCPFSWSWSSSLSDRFSIGFDRVWLLWIGQDLNWQDMTRPYLSRAQIVSAWRINCECHGKEHG